MAAAPPVILYQPFLGDCLRGTCVRGGCDPGWCAAALEVINGFTEEEQAMNTHIQRALEEGVDRRALVRQTLRRPK